MIQNGFVYAVNKSSEKARKQQLKKDELVRKLQIVLAKHDVDLNQTFKITSWSKTDQTVFEKGLKAAGYNDTVLKWYK